MTSPRWSTDTIHGALMTTNRQGIVTKPIFDIFAPGLSKHNDRVLGPFRELELADRQMLAFLLFAYLREGWVLQARQALAPGVFLLWSRWCSELVEVRQDGQFTFDREYGEPNDIKGRVADPRDALRGATACTCPLGQLQLGQSTGLDGLPVNSTYCAHAMASAIILAAQHKNPQWLSSVLPRNCELPVFAALPQPALMA